MAYPRGLTNDTEPFDPVSAAYETEKIVISGKKRKYNLFRVEPFYGQIATARGVGCNLRCGFCWINDSRDYPEKYGVFYSPKEAYSQLIKVSSNKFGRAVMADKARISGCEPTIGRDHLLSLISICYEKGDFRGFLLETNGILLGYDPGFVKDLSRFKEYLHIRLSLKAGTPEAFQAKTGAASKYFELPFKALQYIRKSKIPYNIAAMSKDPKIMPSEERRSLLERIVELGAKNIYLLEEETASPFGKTAARLKSSGIISRKIEIGRHIYEPLHVSLARTAGYKQSSRLSKEKLKQMIRTAEFKESISPCVSCKRVNPWHGHGIVDDADPGLR